MTRARASFHKKGDRAMSFLAWLSEGSAEVDAVIAGLQITGGGHALRSGGVLDALHG